MINHVYFCRLPSITMLTLIYTTLLSNLTTSVMHSGNAIRRFSVPPFSGNSTYFTLCKYKFVVRGQNCIICALNIHLNDLVCRGTWRSHGTRLLFVNKFFYCKFAICVAVCSHKIKITFKNPAFLKKKMGKWIKYILLYSVWISVTS